MLGVVVVGVVDALVDGAVVESFDRAAVPSFDSPHPDTKPTSAPAIPITVRR
jgi:hypothetical protein